MEDYEGQICVQTDSNLISVSQLDDEGYGIAFGGESWKVTKEAHVVAKGQKSGTPYKIATKEVLQGSSGVSKRRKRRDKRVSQPLHIMLDGRRCSDQTSNVNEWIKREVKKEHVADLNVENFQQGNGFGYVSSIAKLVTFNDVLGLEKKTLELGSSSVGVRG
ncbi:hypothetical protein LIER_35973 [Lithospermum erythrorhizon]|uniref:Uncharacterized protein n=1 Tax=Lithospermum erythrorhizon TaxID=34254 RepID=A0AAV3NZT8_LITER